MEGARNGAITAKTGTAKAAAGAEIEGARNGTVATKAGTAKAGAAKTGVATTKAGAAKAGAGAGALTTAPTGTETIPSTKMAFAADPATTSKAVTATIWNGKGWSLGLGLGLGVWGPVAVGLIGASAAYGYYRYRKSGVEEAIAGETSTEGVPEEALQTATTDEVETTTDETVTTQDDTDQADTEASNKE